jgi:hypothetical protein
MTFVMVAWREMGPLELVGDIGCLVLEGERICPGRREFEGEGLCLDPDGV